MGDSQNWGYLFGGPNNKDYSTLGSILGYPYFGKLPYRFGVYVEFREKGARYFEVHVERFRV